MKMSERVKPISHFKSHASQVIRDVVENHSSVVITLNGEAKWYHRFNHYRFGGWHNW